MAAWFPLFINLEGKKILVVGGGTIAERRIRTLLPFGCCLIIVAKEVSPKVAGWSKEGAITLLQRGFLTDDLDAADLVLACTDDGALNALIGKMCRERKIPVNLCSDRDRCDFYFPSVIHHDEVVIGINAGGENHRKVKETRIELEAYFRMREEENEDGNDSETPSSAGQRNVEKNGERDTDG